MKPDRTGIPGYDLCQIHHLLLCPLAGVRRCMEIGSAKAHASLGNHIAGHRAVDSAGQKKHRFPVGSHRHAAGTRDDLRVHIDFIADLYIHLYIRMMHIHTDLRKRIQDRFSQIPADLHGIFRVGLLRPSGLYLKCNVLIRIKFIHISHHVFFQLLKALIFHPNHRTDPYQAEHSF